MRLIPALCTFASTCLLTSAAAAAPGDLLVSEAVNGSVLEFGAGGDLSAATRFATGLDLPTGLCVGPNGDIYVGEIDFGAISGEVTVITAGGDFSAAAPFAFGFDPVIAVACDDNNLFVADQTGVYEASAGGDFSMAMPFASGLAAAGLARDAQDMLWASSVASGEIYNITGGGDFAMAMPHAFGRQVPFLAVFDGMLLGNDLSLPEVLDLTAGGDVSMAMPFAILPNRANSMLDAGPGTLYALSQSSIYEISAGGDFTAATPFAFGLLDGDFAVGGMLRHVCSVDADCDDADACNGVETCVSNACLPAMDLVCDDMDVCTADSCDPAVGCVNDPIMGCCEADADCEADEVCDVPNNMCVPDMMGTTGAGETGGMTTGPGTTTTTGPGTTTAGDGPTGGDDGGTAGADDDGDDGCSCRADRPGGGLAWLVPGLVILATRRRRKC